jgi:pimeloyl-ACP methyl ester carboxylesterase
MQRFRSDDAEIVYTVEGDGPPLVLLHPFPCHHEFWSLVAPMLSPRYRLIVPDLRGHGESGIGEGPATMEKHARDLERLLDDAGVGKAMFTGTSIGGYILFEFWRRSRHRVNSLVICGSRPQADTAEGRANRLKNADTVMEQGSEPFLEGMIPKLMSPVTLSSRPDLVDGVRRMMKVMSPKDIAMVQRGMAERPDSIGDLKTINVPTLIVIGEDDSFATVADGQLMHQHIRGSQFKVIPKAGHFAPWEQSGAVGPLLRQFADSVH